MTCIGITGPKGLIPTPEMLKKACRRYKLRIRGPFVGGLWSCYSPIKPGLSATGLTPEMAYRAWQTYQGIK